MILAEWQTRRKTKALISSSWVCRFSPGEVDNLAATDQDISDFLLGEGCRVAQYHKRARTRRRYPAVPAKIRA